MARGYMGALFLILVVLLKKEKVNWESIKKNLLLLIISGGLIGFNWILLFESYQYTTVATATLCYYMAPIFVILVSPFFFKEKLTGKKAICVAIALLGMILVSGILDAGFTTIYNNIFSCEGFIGAFGANLIFLVGVGTFVFGFILVIAAGAGGAIYIFRHAVGVVSNYSLANVNAVRVTVFGPCVAFQ